MKLFTFGAAVAALGICATAGAQTTPEPIGANLRLGLLFPTNETTADIAGDSFFAFGVDYKIGSLFDKMSYSGSLGLSIDYYRRNDYGQIPILLNYVGKYGRLTYSGGAGVGLTTINNSDDTKFAYQFGLAYDLPTGAGNPVFVEGKFFGSEYSKLNGFGVYVGIRF